MLSLQGEWDLSRAAELRDALVRERAAVRSGPVVVDVAEVSLFDSTCLSVLISVHKHLDAEGDRLVLVGPTPAVLAVLRSTRLDRFLELQP